MYDGKKNTSYEIFYAALETVKTKFITKKNLLLKFGKKCWIM